MDDARWFYDGFGIPGEVGDLIFVGEKKQQARVVKADIQNNVLTLDRDLTWNKGDSVTLAAGANLTLTMNNTTTDATLTAPASAVTISALAIDCTPNKVTLVGTLLVGTLSLLTGTLDIANHAGSISAADLHRAILITQQQKFARVMTTDDWIMEF